MKEFYINIDQTKYHDFLRILESLKNMGIINNFSPLDNLAMEGPEIDEDSLFLLIQKSKQDIKNGFFLSQEEVKEKIEQWRQQRK